MKENNLNSRKYEIKRKRRKNYLENYFLILKAWVSNQD